jgi:CO/xanthine dehydrogenase FAD-binding subunit
VKDFEYTTPKTLDEAIGLLSESGKRGRVMAGGTDLLVQLRGGRFALDRVIDGKAIAELNELSYSAETGLRIGAAVPCYRIYGDEAITEAYPGLIDAAAIIGGIQIQGRATLGGNVCNSSPSGDTIPALIVLEAVCEIAGPNGRREVAVEDFCTAPGSNVLEDGEILIGFHMPAPKARSGAHYQRFIPRYEMDIAVVGVGAALQLSEDGEHFESARIALAAVAPTPLYLAEAGSLLAGRPVSDESIEEAAKAAQAMARPITDMRGTKEFRIHLTGVLTRRVLSGAVDRARGKFVPNAVQEAAG